MTTRFLLLAGTAFALSFVTGCWTGHQRGPAVLTAEETQLVQQQIECLSREAAAGSSDSAVRLGRMYWDGSCGFFDFEQALQLFRDAAAAGNRDALYYQALLFLYGDGVKQDYAAAIRLLKEADSPQSVFALGILYKNGYSGEKNPKKAEECFEYVLTLAPDHSDAMTELGVLAYESEDYPRALEYFQKAYALNNQTAAEWLGLMYWKGCGVNQNREMAGKYLNKTAEELEALETE